MSGNAILESGQVVDSDVEVFFKGSVCRFSQKELIFCFWKNFECLISKVTMTFAVHAIFKYFSYNGKDGIFFRLLFDDDVAGFLRVPNEVVGKIGSGDV